MSKELCGELVVRCFQARNDAHIAHLMTKSYAAHKALNEFYDEIIGLADGFAESAQGRYGILTYPEKQMRHMKVSYGDPQSIPDGLRDWIDEHREECTEHSELQNVIDEIVTLCNETVYKLENLH